MATVRHVFFVPLGPRYFERKSRTEGKVVMPTMAAEVVMMPAMVVRRVAADIVKSKFNERQEYEVSKASMDSSSVWCLLLCSAQRESFRTEARIIMNPVSFQSDPSQPGR